jgi:hypothetical protein
LASGEFTPIEAQKLLAELENIRREYMVLRERRTAVKEWDPLLGRLDDLEMEVKRVRAPNLEESMTQESRIDEGITAGRLRRIKGREFLLRLDAI